MGRRQRSFPPLVGGSSLLVIFGILCLTVFALLSLSTVQAHTRLADGARQAVSDYYAADCAAERILAQLRAGEETPAAVTRSGDICRYTVDITETQKLMVEVKLQDGVCTVLRWQAVPVVSPETDRSVKVWDGEPLADTGERRN